MRRSTINYQRSKGRRLHDPKSLSRNCRGFAYIALLVAIIIIGISLGAAGKYWSNVMLRDKEEELLFRGDQYRMAIERYVAAVPGSQVYPQSIDDLLKDNRTATGKRHLRQKYKDPISGEDFVEIRNTLTKRIIGVHSPSEKEPLKKAGFPVAYPNFADITKYSEWQFVAAIKSVQASTIVSRPVVTAAPRSISNP